MTTERKLVMIFFRFLKKYGIYDKCNYIGIGGLNTLSGHLKGRPMDMKDRYITLLEATGVPCSKEIKLHWRRTAQNITKNWKA